MVDMKEGTGQQEDAKKERQESVHKGPLWWKPQDKELPQTSGMGKGGIRIYTQNE